jgi:hypothetical protein
MTAAEKSARLRVLVDERKRALTDELKTLADGAVHLLVTTALTASPTQLASYHRTLAENDLLSRSASITLLATHQATVKLDEEIGCRDLGRRRVS